MNLQKKNTMIELGGNNLHSNNSSRLYMVNSPTKAVPPLPSREVLESSHRLPLKLSPTKHTASHAHLRIKSGAYENQPSYTDLQQSKLSTKSKISELRPLLVDRSNNNNTSSSKVRISYNDSGRNSPASSRTSSIHISKPAIVSPTPQPNSPQTQSREAELSRKLKILEGRIGELHRQKQEAVGKLNEQNRKIYHENTSLKLKINQLSKRLDKSAALETSINVEKTQSIIQTNTAVEKYQLEVEHLKQQIKQFQSRLAEQTAKNNQLFSVNNELSAQLARITSLCSSQKEELSTLRETTAKQLKELEQMKFINQEFEAHMGSWKSEKQSQEAQIEAIKAQMVDNQQRYSQILKEYQNKIEEYQNAYNQNQSLIKELEDQLRVQESRSIIKEELLEESEYQNKEFSNQCQQLEFNLAQAIQEREDMIAQLQHEKKETQEQLERQAQTIRQLEEAEDDKVHKLEEASALLEKMTARFQQISEKYAELTEKYESEKNKMNKTEGFQSKCKKCDDLLRTVLRLNSQLNPKRSA